MSDTLRARLLDPDFKYIKAADTNIRDLFDRVRLELKEKEKKSSNVKLIRQRGK